MIKNILLWFVNVLFSCIGILFGVHLVVTAFYLAHGSLLSTLWLILVICGMLVAISFTRKLTASCRIPKWFGKKCFFAFMAGELLLLFMAVMLTYVIDNPSVEVKQEAYEIIKADDTPLSFWTYAALPVPIHQLMALAAGTAQELVMADKAGSLEDNYALMSTIADRTAVILDTISERARNCILLWLALGIVHTPGVIYVRSKNNGDNTLSATTSNGSD